LDSAIFPKKACSPTSIAMIMQYYGKNVTIEEVAKACHTFEEGTYSQDAVEGARSLGFPDATLSTGNSMEWLETQITLGKPVWVSINVRTSAHAVVVTGFDADGNVILNDPAHPGSEVIRDRMEFFNAWNGYRNCQAILLK
jgi:uncharacterized protein YvpB